MSEKIFNKENIYNVQVIEYKNLLNDIDFKGTSTDILEFDHKFPNYPLPRWGSNLVNYKNKAIILYGGRDPFMKTNLNDLWLLIRNDLDSTYNWIEISFNDKLLFSEFISLRKCSSLIVDNNLFLLGGYSNDFEFLNNIYALNLNFIDIYIEKFLANTRSIIFSKSLNLENIYTNKGFFVFSNDNQNLEFNQINTKLNQIISKYYKENYFNTYINLTDLDLLLVNKHTIYLTSKFQFYRRINHNDIISSFISKGFNNISNKRDCLDFTYFGFENRLFSLFVNILINGVTPIHLTFYELKKLSNVFDKLKLNLTYKSFIFKLVQPLSQKDEFFKNTEKYIENKLTEVIEQFHNNYINSIYLSLDCLSDNLIYFSPNFCFSSTCKLFDYLNKYISSDYYLIISNFIVSEKLILTYSVLKLNSKSISLDSVILLFQLLEACDYLCFYDLINIIEEKLNELIYYKNLSIIVTMLIQSYKFCLKDFHYSLIVKIIKINMNTDNNYIEEIIKLSQTSLNKHDFYNLLMNFNIVLDTNYSHFVFFQKTTKSSCFIKSQLIVENSNSNSQLKDFQDYKHNSSKINLLLSSLFSKLSTVYSYDRIFN